MLRTLSLIVLLTALAASAAQAKSVYRWVDDDGEVHYGQSVPPEFKDYGYVRLGPDGTIRERVEPALSPEQIQERRRQRAEQARLEAERRSQQTRDRMLLATYSDEADLQQSLQAQLTGIESQRTSTQAALELIERRFETLVSRAARHNRAGRPVPPDLQSSIEETRAERQRLRQELDKLDQREAEARARFKSDLKRYRELTGTAEDGG